MNACSIESSWDAYEINLLDARAAHRATAIPAGASAILKMNFNFNFKDILPAPTPSIRSLTTACDPNHTVEISR
jgi:hypothetical protein